MTTQLQNRCDQLIQMYREISKAEFWNYGRVSLATAGLYLTAGKPLDVARIKECRELLHSMTGFLSDFRQHSEYIICSKLAMQNDPEAYFERLSDIYKKVLPGKIKIGDERAILAAILLADLHTEAERETAIADTKALYKMMKDAHRFLTGGEDIPYAALMALSKWSIDEVFDRAESAFRILKKDFRAKQDAIQALSHILSVCDGGVEALCENACRLYAPLRPTLGTDLNAACLGALAGMGADAGDLAAQVQEADQYLKQHDPFKGFFGINSSDRCLYAVLCTESALADPEAAARSAILTATVQITALIIDQAVTNAIVISSVT